jgi:hypothetical protein
LPSQAQTVRNNANATANADTSGPRKLTRSNLLSPISSSAAPRCIRAETHRRGRPRLPPPMPPRIQKAARGASASPQGLATSEDARLAAGLDEIGVRGNTRAAPTRIRVQAPHGTFIRRCEGEGNMGFGRCDALCPYCFEQLCPFR